MFSHNIDKTTTATPHNDAPDGTNLDIKNKIGIERARNKKELK